MPSNKIAVCVKLVLPESLWIHVYITPEVSGRHSFLGVLQEQYLFVHLLACLLVFLFYGTLVPLPLGTL